VKVINYIGTQTESFSQVHTAQDAIVAPYAFNRIATSEELKICFMVFPYRYSAPKNVFNLILPTCSHSVRVRDGASKQQG